MKVFAPFTEEQVRNLNEYQHLGIMHEFTCGGLPHGGDKTLIATVDGWVCPNCNYTQSWAHLFMTDVKTIKENWNNSEIGKIRPIK